LRAACLGRGGGGGRERERSGSQPPGEEEREEGSEEDEGAAAGDDSAEAAGKEAEEVTVDMDEMGGLESLAHVAKWQAIHIYMLSAYIYTYDISVYRCI
jgi:hypothetical protein